MRLTLQLMNALLLEELRVTWFHGTWLLQNEEQGHNACRSFINKWTI